MCVSLYKSKTSISQWKNKAALYYSISTLTLFLPNEASEFWHVQKVQKPLSEHSRTLAFSKFASSWPFHSISKVWCYRTLSSKSTSNKELSRSRWRFRHREEPTERSRQRRSQQRFRQKSDRGGADRGSGSVTHNVLPLTASKRNRALLWVQSISPFYPPMTEKLKNFTIQSQCQNAIWLHIVYCNKFLKIAMSLQGLNVRCKVVVQPISSGSL